MAYSTPRYVSVSRTSRLTSIAAVVALHVLILGVLSQLAPVRSALNASKPVIVSLLTPAPEKAQTLPKPLPAKHLPPKPREHRLERLPPPPVPPVIAATPVAPTASTITPPADPAPAPAVEAAAPAPVGALASAAPPAPVPAPLTPPSFNAAYLNNPAPAYPTLSRRMGEEGKVVLRVFVNDSGLPQDVQLKSSSGSNRLDSTAVDTVKQWKFVPARRGDTPVGAWVLVPISFSLRS